MRPNLLSILCHLPPSEYDNIVLRAAFTLVFAAFLGVGEFTYRTDDKELGHSFPRWYRTKRSIKVSDDGTYMELSIPASKTDPFRKGMMITIAATKDEGCPVRAMKQLQVNDHHQLHQPKITLRQIRRRCVLTHATLNLRPLRPVHHELRPLRPVRPELPGNARSNSMHLVPNQYTIFCPDILVKATLPPVYPDLSINTIAHHDLPLRDARFRATPEYFLA